MNVQPHFQTFYDGDDTGSYTSVSVIGDYTPTSEIFPFEVTYCGVISRLHYGSQSPNKAPAGSPCSVVSIVNIRNCGNEVCEQFLFGGYMAYSTNTNAFGNMTPGRAWATDFILSGPIRTVQSCLGGDHMLINNHFDGPSLDAPSGAYWAITQPVHAPDQAGPDIHSRAVLNYPVSVGFGVVGFGSGRTSVGFRTGVQVGGVGSNWELLRSHLGTGVAISDYDMIGLYIRRKYSGLTDLVLGAVGSLYTSNPTVVFPAPSDGYAAIGIGILQETTVSPTVAITNPGAGYKTAPIVTFDAPVPTGTTPGTTAQGFANLNTMNQVQSVTVTSVGLKYTTVPGITLTGGGGSGAAATAQLSPVPVAGVSVETPGLGFTAQPGTVPFTGGGGSGANATARILENGLQGIVLLYGGSRYVANHPPGVIITDPGGGTGAEAAAEVGTDGALTAIVMKKFGANYTSQASIAIDPPPTFPNFTAQGMVRIIGQSVEGVSVTDGGGYYTSTPNVTITDPMGGSGAMAVASIFAGRVISVTIISGGSNYNPATTTVSFDPPSATPVGTIATAKAVVRGGIAIAVDNDAGPVVIGGITPLPDPPVPAPAKLTIYTNATPNNKGLVIRGASGQSENIQECLNNSGNVLMSIGKAGAFTGSMDEMPYTPPISLDVSKGTLHKTTITGLPDAATINASAPGNAAQEMTVLIVNSDSANKTITWGTNFKAAGDLVVLALKAAVVRFISDNLIWYEVARTRGL